MGTHLVHIHITHMPHVWPGSSLNGHAQLAWQSPIVPLLSYIICKIKQNYSMVLLIRLVPVNLKAKIKKRVRILLGGGGGGVTGR
jgi:hypothetical protein